MTLPNLTVAKQYLNYCLPMMMAGLVAFCLNGAERWFIGATQKSILSQFILEGLILVAVGTALGLMFSYAVVSVLSSMALPEWIGLPVITPDSIAWSLLVTLILALMASYFPARRASRLTPVIALSARA